MIDNLLFLKTDIHFVCVIPGISEIDTVINGMY